jgi:DNA-directed RNA polymerase specialized sigma24 family protein
LLRYWGGLSVRETAVVMRRTQAAVKMLVSRAVSDLKERCWHYEMD